MAVQPVSGSRVVAVRRVRSLAQKPAETVRPVGVDGILGAGGSISRMLSGYRDRPQQMDLSHFVADCIKDRVHGLGEAPTGVGKSLAYLVPAILSGRRTVVAVPTIALQEQIVNKDLPFLSQPGVMPKPFRYALLKGRRNYACNLKAEQFLENPTVSHPSDVTCLPILRDWYEATPDGDIGKLSITLPQSVQAEITASSDECLGEKCQKYAVCFGERAKARSAGADVIVTNYSMLMLHLRLKAESDGMVKLLPDDVEIIVLDECHQTRQKAQDALTVEATLGRYVRIANRMIRLARKAQGIADTALMLRMAIEAADAEREEREPVLIAPSNIEREWTDRFASIEGIFRRVLAQFSERLGEESAMKLGDESEIMHQIGYPLHVAYIDAMDRMPAELEDTDRIMWDKAASSLGALVDDLTTILMPSGRTDIVRFVSRDGDDVEKVVLSYVPIDVAPFLHDNLWTARATLTQRDAMGRVIDSRSYPLTTINVSATIAENGTLDYHQETVGLDESGCREIIVGSPFDYARDTLLYIPADIDRFNSTEARKDQKVAWPAYLRDMTDETIRLCNASGGRAFVLFTSRVVMDHVYSEMVRRAQMGPGRLPWPLMKQGDAPLTELVAQFKARPSVLFGVKSFWEGVDIPGEALSLVIISGMPFTPPSDPIFSARCEMADRRYGRGAGFSKVAIPEAIINIKQAFGRGKRTETDRAVMAILDTRLRTKGYGKRTLNSLPDAPLTGDFADVRRFFGG